MEKRVYIFNCTGTFDLCKDADLYHKVSKVIDIDCNKYGCVFMKSDGKYWSRSGTIKNIERNIQKYLLLNDYTISIFKTLEVYDKPENAQPWDLEKRRYGFFVNAFYEGEFYIYVVLPYTLNKAQMLGLWDLFSGLYATNYMVHFTLDAKKDVEIYMYGNPMIRGLETPEEYYSPNELSVLDKLHYLHRKESYDLGNVFPVCITTKGISINEQSYKYKTIVDSGVVIYEK